MEVILIKSKKRKTLVAVKRSRPLRENISAFLEVRQMKCGWTLVKPFFFPLQRLILNKRGQSVNGWAEPTVCCSPWRFPFILCRDLPHLSSPRCSQSAVCPRGLKYKKIYCTDASFSPSPSSLHLDPFKVLINSFSVICKSCRKKAWLRWKVGSSEANERRDAATKMDDPRWRFGFQMDKKTFLFSPSFWQIYFYMLLFFFFAYNLICDNNIY